MGVFDPGRGKKPLICKTVKKKKIKSIIFDHEQVKHLGNKKIYEPVT